MARATIDVRLTNGNQERGLVCYEPGAILNATVQVVADGEMNCRRINVSAGWHTEGRGDRDGKVISQADIFQGVLQAGSPLIQDVALSLPVRPWSYAGHYVNIVWEVTVNIDVPRGKDVSYSLPFVMALRQGQ